MKWQIKVLIPPLIRGGQEGFGSGQKPPQSPLSGGSNTSLTTVHQVHGGTIVDATRAQRERLDADGILMHLDDQPVAIFTADCLPMIITSDSAALALHVSRKTLIHGLLDHVPKFIPSESIKSIFLGPHICSEHFVFEHEGEDIKVFRKKFPGAITTDPPFHLSLKSAVQDYLDAWHVSPDILQHDPRCTFEDLSLPSYKRWRLENAGKYEPRIATIVYASGNTH